MKIHDRKHITLTPDDIEKAKYIAILRYLNEVLPYYKLFLCVNPWIVI